MFATRLLRNVETITLKEIDAFLDKLRKTPSPTNPNVNITIPRAELMKVFHLLEETAYFFHNPDIYDDHELRKKFVKLNYDSLNKIRFKVFDWIPEETEKEKITHLGLEHFG